MIRRTRAYGRLASRIRRGRLYRMLRRRPDRAAVATWEAAGRPVPPPSAVKRARLVATADTYGLRTLVETGTYHGRTVEAMLWRFDRIVSIELDAALAAAARDRLGGAPGLTLLEGDSAALLPGVVASLDGPALFWLDAHWSGGATAHASSETPVLAELECVLADARPHVVLIDDAREFLPGTDYPSLDELRRFVGERRPELRIEIADDVIALLP